MAEAARRPPHHLRNAALGRAAASRAVWPASARAETAPNSGHSRRVAFLKRTLPAVGLAMLLLIALWPQLAPLWERMRFGFPAIDLRDARELRMVNPRYAGIDRLGRPFVITAATGRQVPDRQDLLSLEKPRADMKTHGGAEVVVTSATGIYQSQTQLLDLFGTVTLEHQNGTRFVTGSARADLAGNTAEGNDPVVGHGPSGDVQADGFRILDKGDTIIFTGHSDMVLQGAHPVAGNTPPAGLPAAVAASAAYAEAEARPLLAAAAHMARQAPAAHEPARPAHHAAVHRETVHREAVHREAVHRKAVHHRSARQPAHAHPATGRAGKPPVHAGRAHKKG